MSASLAAILLGTPMAPGVPVSLGAFGSAPAAFSTGTLTTTANILAGDLVVIAVFNNATNTITVSSISDGTNTYTKATGQVISANTEGELWYKSNAAAVSSGATITVTFSGTSGAGGGYGICAARAAMVRPASPLDVVSGTSSTSATSLSTTSAALAAVNEIVFAFNFAAPAQTYSGAAGFTNVNTGATSGGNGSGWLDYLLQNSVAAVTYAPVWGGPAGRVGAMQAAFRGY